MCACTHTEIYLKIKNKTPNNFKTQSSTHSIPLEITTTHFYICMHVKHTKCFIFFTNYLEAHLSLKRLTKRNFKDSSRRIVCIPPSFHPHPTAMGHRQVLVSASSSWHAYTYISPIAPVDSIFRTNYPKTWVPGPKKNPLKKYKTD